MKGIKITLIFLFCILIKAFCADNIYVAGYMDTQIYTAGGTLNLLAITPDIFNEVEILYMGHRTGLKIPLSFSSSGFNVFQLIAPVGATIQPLELLFEAKGYGKNEWETTSWPYLPMLPDSIGREMAIFYYLKDDVVVPLLAEKFKNYLEKMTGKEITIIPLNDWSEVLQIVNKFDRAGFLLNPQIIAPSLFPDFATEPFAEEEYQILAKKQGNKYLYLIGGQGKLGIQYAVYDFLYQLGVRFFHPEEEWIPDHFSLKYPLNIRSSPAFKYRGMTVHTIHPLEVLETLSDSNVSISYAINLNDWMVKRHCNMDGKGAVRGVAPEHRFIKRAKQLNEYITLLGFKRAPGISLHSAQQGARPDIDWGSSVPPEDQIRQHIDRDMQNFPDAEWYGISFGPTEYTTTPDIETVYYLNFTGKYILQQYPSVLPRINSHITGNQPSPNYNNVDYYDLPIFTDTNISIQWHTVMFYDLFGPAPCYGQTTFNHKYRYMLQEAAKGRKQWFFPEAAYWLSFDNQIPLFYPVYLYTRWLDIQAVKELILQGMIGHKLFTSGQEWGYWMNDYLVGQLHWNPDLNWTEIVKDWTVDIMGEAGTKVHRVMVDMVRYQYDTLIQKGLTKYLSGEDELDEIGAQLGYQAQELRVPFKDLLRWDDTTIKDFESGDLNLVLLMAKRYDLYRTELENVSSKVPEKAKPWFNEIYDGTCINALRSWHIYYLYQAVIKYIKNTRSNALENRDFMLDYNLALELTEHAKSVIACRERQYRYPLEWSIGGGLTPETEQDNGTVYKYRYLHKTHIAYFWERRNKLAYQVISGQSDPFGDRFYLKPAIAPPSTPVEVHFPNYAGLTADIDFGDGTRGDETITTHTYQGKGLWEVNATLFFPGLPEPEQKSHCWIARVDIEAYAGRNSITVIEPDIDLINMVIRSICPPLHFGLEPGSSTPFFVVGIDLNEDGVAEDFTNTPFSMETITPSDFKTNPSDMDLTFQYGNSGSLITIKLVDVIFFGEIEGMEMVSPLYLEGGLETESVINALVAIGGMDYEGARILLANILGVEPDNLPSAIEFKAEFQVEPIQAIK